MHQIPLFLNDVAGSEIVLIIFVVLLLFGSKSIPGIAKTLGKALYQVRNATNDLQQEIRKSSQQMKEDLNLKEIIKETEESINASMEEVKTEINHTVDYGSLPKQVKQQVTAGNPTEEIKSNPIEENNSNSNT